MEETSRLHSDTPGRCYQGAGWNVPGWGRGSPSRDHRRVEPVCPQARLISVQHPRRPQCDTGPCSVPPSRANLQVYRPPRPTVLRHAATLQRLPRLGLANLSMLPARPCQGSLLSPPLPTRKARLGSLGHTKCPSPGSVSICSAPGLGWDPGALCWGQAGGEGTPFALRQGGWGAAARCTEPRRMGKAMQRPGMQAAGAEQTTGWGMFG